MSIPEGQLQTWSNVGATTTLKSTHEIVRNALARYTWPGGITYSDYLQGSYANDTHTRATSDVDIVIELTSSFYSNLTEDQKRALGHTTAGVGLAAFRREVIAALVAALGGSAVNASGANAIKLPAASGRQNADVVACASYRRYEDLSRFEPGITFWNQTSNVQIVNYPKQHIENGVSKNAAGRTAGRYKPSVRMFKNARVKAFENEPTLMKEVPSYFLESLLYNVPDSKFTTSCGDTYCACVNFVATALQDGSAGRFVTQSGRHYLFGVLPFQWTKEAASDLTARLTGLWNNWK